MILYMEGTERYLKLKEIKKAASLLADKDFCYQEFWAWDDSILEFISAPPFFGDKKICVLYFFPEDDRLLKTSIWEGTDIYILTENMPDRRKNAVTQLLKAAEVKKYEKIHEDILYKCIFQKIARTRIQAGRDQCSRRFSHAGFLSLPG